MGPTAEFLSRIEAGEIGHWGIYREGQVWCSWCKAHTPTGKKPPLSVVCCGCRRWVRAEQPSQPTNK